MTYSRRIQNYLLAPFILTSIFAMPVEVNLKDPIYESNEISTSSGGSLATNDFYIQARNIRAFIRDSAVQKAEANTNVIALFDGFIIKAQSVSFNEAKSSLEFTNCTIFDGEFELQSKVLNVDMSMRMIHGEGIALSFDGVSPYSLGVFATKGSLRSDKSFSISKLRPTFLNVPYFFIPKITLSRGKSSYFLPIVYYEKEQGLYTSVTLPIQSSQNNKANLHAFFRFKGGVGLSFNVKRSEKSFDFSSSHSIAYTTLPKASDNQKKQLLYRLQGSLRKENQDTSLLKGSYDVFSNILQPSNFHSSLNNGSFLKNDHKKTEVYITHIHEKTLYNLNIRVKPNSFEALSEKIPSFIIALSPLKIPLSYLTFTPRVSASILKYSFPKQSLLQSYASLKASSSFDVRGTIRVAGISFFHEISPTVTLYSNDTRSEQLTMCSLPYSIKLSFPLLLSNVSSLYKMTPFVHLSGTAKSQGKPHVFSIYDSNSSFTHLNIGNEIFSHSKKSYFNLIASISHYSQSDRHSLHANITSIFKSKYLVSKVKLRFDIHNKNLENSEVLFGFNLRNYFSTSIGHGYRSCQSLRRIDVEDSFIPIMNGSLFSPLSYRNNYIVSKTAWNFSRTAGIKGTVHAGFGRENRKSYCEYEISAFKKTHKRLEWSIVYNRREAFNSIAFRLKLLNF